MQKSKKINYWLLQIKTTDFRLLRALKANELKVYPVKSHRTNIQKGDKIIIWKTGKNGGCYALATAISDTGKWPFPKNELPFFKSKPSADSNIKLKIDLNLWEIPILTEQISVNKSFDRFSKELPGLNYKVTEKQYTFLNELAQLNLAEKNAQKEYLPFDKTTDHPLNLILYGPPGTGKTYNAISLAVAIIENKSLEKVAKKDRSKLRLRFNEYMTEGQIGFVTFHHAYTYEDFVEGVKPRTENQNIIYDIEEGIFKQLAFEAKRNMLETLMSNIPKKEIKISFNQLYKAFLQYIKSDQFNSFVSANKNRVYLHRIGRNGDFVVRKENTYNTNTVSKNKLRIVYENVLTIEQIRNIDADIKALVDGVNTNIFYGVFKELKFFEGEYIKALALLQQQGEASDNTVESFELGALADMIKGQTKKYVLIIDEINRGDVSNIFGELITLLEEDKREGNAEGLLVQLPYSKSHFCVPSNLYIIGTMNTAGQSIELLDLALRRRFDFLEMEPDSSIIKKVNKNYIIDGIDLAKMLDAINERIEILIGRDFRIGHTHFLKIETLADLKDVFVHKIIPLLQEYFENDFLRIGLILGKDFVQKKVMKNSAIFADFDVSAFEEEYMESYQLRPINKLPSEAFIRIYDKDFEA